MKPNPHGAAGEEYAAKTLQKLGYRIRERNFSSKYGEIDIIAEKDGILAFVEVKSRRTGSCVSGFEAVNKRKQRKIIITAVLYMKKHKTGLQPRFDVFYAKTQNGEAVAYEYIEGAFDSGAYPEYY